MILVAGQCPMGCGEQLIRRGEDRQLWCACSTCPRPTAAAEILADSEPEHVVIITPAGEVTIRHPLRERLDDALLSCELHLLLASASAPELMPDRYRATRDGDWWSFTRLGTRP